MSDEWKNFYICNPWANPSILIEKFGIKQYDIDNWRRANPNVKSILDRAKWKLSQSQSKEDTFSSLKFAWRYYITSELEWKLTDTDIDSNLLSLSSPKSPYAFLTDKRYLSKLDGYDLWTQQRFTAVSYAICNIYPGGDWSAERGLSAQLFTQTRNSIKDKETALGLIEHIYLKFYKKLGKESSQKEIDDAKKIFIARHTEQGFFSNKVLQDYGFKAKYFCEGLNTRKAMKEIAYKFSKDLNLGGIAETKNWNTEKYRLQNPERDFSKCMYCGRAPVDLHHLIARSKRPEFTYNAFNVVPLCTQAHANISRKRLSANIIRAYAEAEKSWFRSDDTKKIEQFNKVMANIHITAYGTS